MGKASRRHRHRHGRLAREGRTRAREWLRPCHRLQQGGFRRAGEGDHRQGEGCHVVYDGVGKATFPASLDCLRPFGTFVSFGSASGSIPPFDIMLLMQKGSLFATWQLLFHHLAKREDVARHEPRTCSTSSPSGAVKIPVHTRLPLAEVAEAHRRLEARQTTGATVLIAVELSPAAASSRKWRRCARRRAYRPSASRGGTGRHRRGRAR